MRILNGTRKDYIALGPVPALDGPDGDIDNLPSLKGRKALSEKDAIDVKAFRTIERV